MNKDKIIEDLMEQNERLRKSVGAWKRKAKGEKPRREHIREGHRDYFHYKVYVLDDFPADLHVQEVLQLVKEEVLPEVYPYRYSGIDYSNRYDSWLLQVKAEMDVDMSYFPSRLTQLNK